MLRLFAQHSSLPPAVTGDRVSCSHPETLPCLCQASAAVTVLEQTTAPPPLPQIIADYVGRAPAGALNARLANPLSASMHLPRPPGGAPAALPDPSPSPPLSAGAPSLRRALAGLL